MILFTVTMEHVIAWQLFPLRKGASTVAFVVVRSNHVILQLSLQIRYVFSFQSFKLNRQHLFP